MGSSQHAETAVQACKMFTIACSQLLWATYCIQLTASGELTLHYVCLLESCNGKVPQSYSNMDNITICLLNNFATESMEFWINLCICLVHQSYRVKCGIYSRIMCTFFVNPVMCEASRNRWPKSSTGNICCRRCHSCLKADCHLFAKPVQMPPFSWSSSEQCSQKPVPTTGLYQRT